MGAPRCLVLQGGTPGVLQGYFGLSRLNITLLVLKRDSRSTQQKSAALSGKRDAFRHTCSSSRIHTRSHMHACTHAFRTFICFSFDIRMFLAMLPLCNTRVSSVCAFVSLRAHECAFQHFCRQAFLLVCVLNLCVSIVVCVNVCHGAVWALSCHGGVYSSACAALCGRACVLRLSHRSVARVGCRCLVDEPHTNGAVGCALWAHVRGRRRRRHLRPRRLQRHVY
jgi:hypothetical protein